MTIRFASATALGLSLAVLGGSVCPAHADAGYAPYYDTRDSVQYSNVQTSQNYETTMPPAASSPGQAAAWQAPRETVANSGALGVPQNWGSESPLFHYNNAVWISGGTMFDNYKNEGPISASVRGWSPSIAAGASYMNHYDTYFALNGSDAFGDTTFRISGPPASQSTNHSTIYNIDGKIGQGFSLAPNFMLLPYGDVGYRDWIFDGSSGIKGYRHNFSVMGGLMAEVSPIPRLFLTGYGAGGTTLGSHLERDNSTTGNTSYTVGDSGIYDVGGKAGFLLTPRIEAFSAVDYVHFNYGQSSVASDGSYQPSAHINDTTVRVGLGYHFR